MPYEYFVWDHKDIAPIKSIVDLIKKNPNWNLYEVEDGTTDLQVIVAPSLADAKQGLLEAWKDAIEDAKEDGEDWSPGKVRKWEGD